MAAKNLLQLMAIGDAFGMRFEFIRRTFNITEIDLHYGGNALYPAYKAGHYSDDTQMTLANARLLLSNHEGRPLTDEAIIANWLSLYQDDPREGYSRSMAELLKQSRTPAAFISANKNANKDTSGAAMRAAPFGLHADLQAVRKQTQQQARITHNSSDGVNAALAASLTVHFLHHGGKKARLDDFLHTQMTTAPNDVYIDDPKNGFEIVAQALDAYMHSDSFSEILLNGTNFYKYSDTDTVCALAMTFAACDDDMIDDLPARLRVDHNTPPYNFEYLKNIDRQLESRFPAQSLYSKWKHRPATSNGAPSGYKPK
jgi:ADP-ribosyl-[dinitrogen reductase] hydrolase